MKNFALIGLAGYIAPRHLEAISATGNRVVAAFDPHDSVGVADRFFPDADFFTEFERFDRHAEKLRRLGEGRELHYVTICSPNYLHDSHIRFALRSGAHAVCEKPLVLNPWNLDALEKIEGETGKKVYTLLQLRYQPDLIQLKNQIAGTSPAEKHEVELTYITGRGKWYRYSWKGDEVKSGGVATNIGIHFFDLLTWIFGGVESAEVHLNDHDKASGYLELERARVRWYLSTDVNDLSEKQLSEGNRTFRSISVDGDEVEFSNYFTDLHTVVYEKVLEGIGPGIAEARSSISLAHRIRVAPICEPSRPSHRHPMVGA